MNKLFLLLFTYTLLTANFKKFDSSKKLTSLRNQILGHVTLHTQDHETFYYQAEIRSVAPHYRTHIFAHNNYTCIALQKDGLVEEDTDYFCALQKLYQEQQAKLIFKN